MQCNGSPIERLSGRRDPKAASIAPRRPLCSLGRSPSVAPGGPGVQVGVLTAHRGAGPAADRLLLRPPVHRGAAGASRIGVLLLRLRQRLERLAEIFGALPLVAGTLITSAIALAASACRSRSPARCSSPSCARAGCARRSRSLVELLAAVPSVVYGLWGIFVADPEAQAGPSSGSADTFSFLPFVGGAVAGPNYFIAGLILAIMILPIVSAISREVIATVPAGSQGGDARARRDPLGDDPHRGAALRALRASSAPRCSASAARSARRSP